MSLHRYLQVYEHQNLKEEDQLPDARTGELIEFTESDRQALERYHGRGTPFFALIHKGVRFNEHVGVLQVRTLTIEVLPKADALSAGTEAEEKVHWQHFLLTMLRSTGTLPKVSSQAHLRLRGNSVLDLYMQLFLKEVRYLLQTGLVRKYLKKSGNRNALKGKLQFTENIRHNCTHAERFYVRYQEYNRDNVYNALLGQTLLLIQQISNVPAISNSAASLLLDFPEYEDVKISESLFKNLRYDRKTESYRTALGIAKLLLMRFHPDVRRGKSEVLALMFNMNRLWEAYVVKQLRKELDSSVFEVYAQQRNDFWEPTGGRMRIVKPDIVVKRLTEPLGTVAVLDTKWKKLQDLKAADTDLKQMLVYNLHNNCERSALVYPGNADFVEGTFSYKGSTCRLICLPLKWRIEDCEQPGVKLDLTRLKNWIEQSAGNKPKNQD